MQAADLPHHFVCMPVTFVGDIEPFYCETLTFIDNLKSAGIEAKVDVYQNCFHAFDMLTPFRKVSKEAIAKFEKEYLNACEKYFAEQKDHSKYDALKLENQLCFPLYACSREIVKRYKPFLDEIGLTYTQYIAMMVMWERKSVNVKELGECLYLDSGTLTPLLKKLESKGYVTRMRSDKDERNLVVAITEDGEKLKDKAIEIPFQIAGCTNLTPEEGLQLYGILYRILGKTP